MPVKLTSPKAESLLPVRGVKLGVAEANIRKLNRKDVLVITLAEGSKLAGVFTLNQFCAAPVVLCKDFLSQKTGIRALLVNTGCANAGTGTDGLDRAKQTCEALGGLLNLQFNQIFLSSMCLKFFSVLLVYSNHLNTKHLNTGFI